MLLRIRQLVLSILLVLTLLLSGCSHAENSSAGTPIRDGILEVHFLDVGQGDSALAIFPRGKAMLIDGGNNDDGQKILSYLKSHGVKELSAIIATHPHEDHIGGLDLVLQNIPAKSVYMPNAAANTKTFEDFMEAVKNSGAKRIQAKAGVILDVPDITGQFLAPNNSSYEELNNYSAVLKVTYGQVSFLFEGDAEDISEGEMIKMGQDLKATVLKVGHHGSISSTTSEFLKAVSPKYAIISVGADNEYGHPTPTVLGRLAKTGVEVYRTDQSGTIVATTDGTSLQIDKPSTSIASDTSSINPPSTSDPSSMGSVELSNIDFAGEVVTITNTSKAVVNLEGWKLVSEVGQQTYTFPPGTTLTGGGLLKVVSGDKALAGSGILVWSQSNIWNNEGDPGALYNAQGMLVSKR